MDGDAQSRQVVFQVLDGRVEAFVGDLVARVRAARKKKSTQIATRSKGAHLGLEVLGHECRDHRAQNFSPAMISHQRAGGTRDREHRKRGLAAAGEFIGGKILK